MTRDLSYGTVLTDPYGSVRSFESHDASSTDELARLFYGITTFLIDKHHATIASVRSAFDGSSNGDE